MKGIPQRVGSSRAALMLACLLAMVAPTPGSSSQGRQFSDTEAKEAVEKYWKSSSNALRVYLGDFQVVRERSNLSKRRLSLSEFNLYEAWKDLGFIKIVQRKDLSENFTGWDDWNKLFLDGVQLEVQIQPTSEGMPMRVEQKGEMPAFLLIPLGTSSIEKIVQNESLKLGTDDYRVVLGIHTTDYTQEAKYYFRKIKVSSAAEKKFKALLKYDPFTSGWSVVAQDIADRDREFATDNVNAFVKARQ